MATMRSIPAPHRFEILIPGAVEVVAAIAAGALTGVVEDEVSDVEPLSRLAVDGFISEPTPLGAVEGPGGL